METTPRKKKGKEKNLKRFPLASIFLFISLGVVSSYLKWENLFFISRSYLLGVFFPLLLSQTTSNCYFFCNWWCLANVRNSLKIFFLDFLEVSFYLLEKTTKKKIVLRWQRRQSWGAIKSKHLSWHKSEHSRDRNQTTILVWALEMKIVVVILRWRTREMAIKSFYCLLTISLLAIMNRFLIFSLRNDCRHSTTRNVSKREIYCNFYALFGFIVTISARNTIGWDCPAINFATALSVTLRIKNHHVFSTTLSRSWQKSWL